MGRIFNADPTPYRETNPPLCRCRLIERRYLAHDSNKV
jgi:hypothetical protein